MDALVVIKSLALTLLVIAPVVVIFAGIYKSLKIKKMCDKNFEEWSNELDLYCDAINRGDLDAAEVHNNNMDLIDSELLKINKI